MENNSKNYINRVYCYAYYKLGDYHVTIYSIIDLVIGLTIWRVVFHQIQKYEEERSSSYNHQILMACVSLVCQIQRKRK
jgi:hypothetical protein